MVLWWSPSRTAESTTELELPVLNKSYVLFPGKGLAVELRREECGTTMTDVKKQRHSGLTWTLKQPPHKELCWVFFNVFSFSWSENDFKQTWIHRRTLGRISICPYWFEEFEKSYTHPQITVTVYLPLNTLCQMYCPLMEWACAVRSWTWLFI